MRFALLAAGLTAGFAASAGAQAASLSLLTVPSITNQSLIQTVRDDHDRDRDGRHESCERVRHECTDNFEPGSWRFRRCVRNHDCG